MTPAAEPSWAEWACSLCGPVVLFALVLVLVLAGIERFFVRPFDPRNT